MLNLKNTTLAATMALIASPFAATSALAETSNATNADEEGRIEIGYLVCHMTSQDAGIILSEQEFTCDFDPADDDFSNERYVASFNKIGLDLSITEAETLRWAVFAPAAKYKDDVLEGEYGGISADIALGAGIGAKALVGGLEESIALQPVSVTTQTGLGASLGFETLTLRHIPNS
jgi:hypothetical protein